MTNDTRPRAFTPNQTAVLVGAAALIALILIVPASREFLFAQFAAVFTGVGHSLWTTWHFLGDLVANIPAWLISLVAT